MQRLFRLVPVAVLVCACGATASTTGTPAGSVPPDPTPVVTPGAPGGDAGGGAGAPLAGGAWSLQPLPADPSFRDHVDACLTQSDVEPGMRLVVQDQRTPDLAAMLFVGSTSELTAFVRRAPGGSFTCEPVGGGSLPEIGGTDIGIAGETNVGDNLQEAWLVDGYVGERASRVVISRASGQDVVASVGGGRFLAMWRGKDDVDGLFALDAGGSVIARDDSIGIAMGEPEESVRVIVTVDQSYDGVARAMTFTFHASDAGLLPGIGPEWTLTRADPEAYWQFLGPSGSGDFFGDGKVDATLTLRCEDLVTELDNESTPSVVDLEYRAGDIEKKGFFSSESTTAFGSWSMNLPACPAAPSPASS